MADRRKMNRTEINKRLESLRGWSVANEKLHREFQFKDFKQAFAFMTGGALVAERLNHHPEWCNVYNRVVIDLTTHDAGGITENDFAFAESISAMLPLDRVS